MNLFVELIKKITGECMKRMIVSNWRVRNVESL